MEENLLSKKNSRNFAILHHDAWKTFIRAPLIFALLPVIIYFPFDWIVEYIYQNTTGSEFNKLRIYFKLSGLIEIFIGSWLSCVLIISAKNISDKEKTDIITVIKFGTKHYWKVVGAIYSASWRIALGLIFLLIPGIILSIKYALSVPVSIFEDITFKDSINRSKEYMSGVNFKYFMYFAVFILIYFPAFIGISIFNLNESSPFIEAVFSIPFNVFESLFIIGLVLIYSDLNENIKFGRPIGNLTKECISKGEMPEDSNGLYGIFITIIISIFIFVFGFSYSNYSF